MGESFNFAIPAEFAEFASNFFHFVQCSRPLFSIGSILLPRLGSFALLKGPKARSFSLRFCFVDLNRFFAVGVVGFVSCFVGN